MQMQLLAFEVHTSADGDAHRKAGAIWLDNIKGFDVGTITAGEEVGSIISSISALLWKRGLIMCTLDGNNLVCCAIEKGDPRQRIGIDVGVLLGAPVQEALHLLAVRRDAVIGIGLEHCTIPIGVRSSPKVMTIISGRQ